MNIKFLAFSGLFLLVTVQVVFADNSGAIWTTRNDCGDIQQDVNHYAIGEEVYINGANFKQGYKYWIIKGQPGEASCDPNLIVASGRIYIDKSGTFCFNAYTVADNDCGEYKVNVGNKGDNYHVDEETTTTIPTTTTTIPGQGCYCDDQGCTINCKWGYDSGYLCNQDAGSVGPDKPTYAYEDIHPTTNIAYKLCNPSYSVWISTSDNKLHYLNITWHNWFNVSSDVLGIGNVIFSWELNKYNGLDNTHIEDFLWFNPNTDKWESIYWMFDESLGYCDIDSNNLKGSCDFSSFIDTVDELNEAKFSIHVKKGTSSKTAPTYGETIFGRVRYRNDDGSLIQCHVNFECLTLETDFIKCPESTTTSTTTTSTTIPTTTTTSVPCILTEAYWTKTLVREEENVQLIVKGENCDGEALDLTYFEEDDTETAPTGSFLKTITGKASGIWDHIKSLLGLGSENDPINPDDYNLPKTIIFYGDTAAGNWNAVWFEDIDGEDEHPEIIFMAHLEDQSVTSNILKIIKEETPTTSTSSTSSTSSTTTTTIPISLRKYTQPCMSAGSCSCKTGGWCDDITTRCPEDDCSYVCPQPKEYSSTTDIKCTVEVESSCKCDFEGQWGEPNDELGRPSERNICFGGECYCRVKGVCGYMCYEEYIYDGQECVLYEDYVSTTTTTVPTTTSTSSTTSTTTTTIPLITEYTKPCTKTGSCSCKPTGVCGSNTQCISQNCGYSCPAALSNSVLAGNICSSGHTGNSNCACNALCQGGSCSCTISGTCNYKCNDGYYYDGQECVLQAPTTSVITTTTTTTVPTTTSTSTTTTSTSTTTTTTTIPTTTTMTCSCGSWSAWKDAGCGKSPCTSSQMKQTRTRTCTPSDCSAQSQSQCTGCNSDCCNSYCKNQGFVSGTCSGSECRCRIILN